MLCSRQDTDLGPGHHRRALLILAVPLTCSLMLTGSPSCPACSRAHACRPFLPACSPLRSAPRLASAARPPPSQALTSPDRWWVHRVSSSNQRTGPARLPGPTWGQSVDRTMSSSVSAWQGVVSLGGGRPAVHLPGHRSQEFILPLGHVGCVGTAVFLLETPGDGPFPCFLQLQEAAHCPWPVASGQQYWDSDVCFRDVSSFCFSHGPL